MRAQVCVLRCRWLETFLCCVSIVNYHFRIHRQNSWTPTQPATQKKEKKTQFIVCASIFFLERRNTFVPHMEQHFSLVSLLWCSIAAPLLHPFIQTPSGYCLSQTKYIAYKYTIMIFHEFFVFSSVGLGNQFAMATLFIKLIPLCIQPQQQSFPFCAACALHNVSHRITMHVSCS